ncbi:MAG: hypothetical protein K0S98_1511 [Propionibacteriaceae bacterium]|jgi:hypothetical protein|nr:hypothetical protein [Propionibacteriaceae bacterium]
MPLPFFVGSLPFGDMTDQVGVQAGPGLIPTSARGVLSAFAGSTPVANVQQETAATNARSGAFGCDYSRLAVHE